MDQSRGSLRESGRRFPRARRVVTVLPIEVKAHRKYVGCRLAIDCIFCCHRMNPVEHDASPIAPVPVETGRNVVVLTPVEFIEIEMGVTCLQFPCPRAVRSGHDEEI